MSMPSSSWSSRPSATSGASPSRTLPPGNSHSPAMGLPGGRRARSTRPSTSISAAAATRTIGATLAGGSGIPSHPVGASAPIAAIDVDIPMGQIAAPHHRLASTNADVDRDVDLAPGHVLGDRGFVIARHGLAVGGDRDAAYGDLETIAIGFFA